MISNSCPYETKVSQAARTGCWDNLIREHIRQCSQCEEIARISERLNTAAIEGTSTLPDPEQIWMNARILAMQSARKRALRPLAIAELTARTVITLGLAAGIAWLWHEFPPQAANLRLSSLLLQKPLIATVAALATCLATLGYTRLASN